MNTLQTLMLMGIACCVNSGASGASGAVYVAGYAPVYQATYYPYYYPYYYAAPPLLYQCYGQAPAIYCDAAMRQYVVCTASGQTPYGQCAPVRLGNVWPQVAHYVPHPQVAYCDAAQGSETTPVAHDDPMVTIPDRAFLEERFWLLKMHRCARRTGLLKLAGQKMRRSDVREKVVKALTGYERYWLVAPSMKKKTLDVLLGRRPVRYKSALTQEFSVIDQGVPYVAATPEGKEKE